MGTDGIRVCASADLEWTVLAGGAVRQKTVRNDEATGEFLGLMAIEPLTRTGLHRHLDVAFAYHLSGSSTNHSTVIRPGQLGVTLDGTVHETVIYAQALTVVRTEGRTMYPRSAGDVHVHSGAVHGEMKVEDPQWCGCLCIDPEQVEPRPTGVDGVLRRMLFDYSLTGKHRRLAEFSALPGSAVAPHRTAARLEMFVIAGDLTVNGIVARASDFVLVEPGATMAWDSSFGCRVLVWADGPSTWTERGPERELYGFGG